MQEADAAMAKTVLQVLSTALLQEMHEIWPTGTPSPCPNAYILCLQRR